ncbi:MAG: hypothetical protein AUI93_02025 [Crenarchaeota archaeon 13_1_40CM_3_52_10]|nr:MAG: hypothetical protein AUI93_02025 [Crenarchaeota archaeon 13_1_40CM_3_52_10]
MNRRVGAIILITVSLVVALGIGLAKPTITKLSPPSQGQVASLGDNFNSSLWIATKAGSGASVIATNRTVQVSIPANSANDPSLGIFGAGLSSRCTVSGDFDVQVGFRLVNWTFSNGVRVGLASTPGPFFTSDFSVTPPFAVERISFGSAADGSPSLPREAYLTHFSDGVQGITATSDVSGSLRLVRSGGFATGYYLSSGNWVMIHTGPTISQDVHLNIVAWSHDFVFTHTFVKVAFDNFTLNKGSAACPALTLSPTRGPLGTKVVVQGSGFPVSPFGPGTIMVDFDDMLLGFATDTNGTFSFAFNIPDAQPGPHLVKALDELTGTSAVASFQVTQVNSLALSVDVGTLYFPGDTVAIYTLATLSGTPLNSTSLQLLLTLTRPDGSNITVVSSSIGGGLFKGTYAIPKTGPVGTYSVVARGHVANVQDFAALATFEVKLTWLSAQGPALTTAAVATVLTGLVVLGTIGWRKSFFRTKPTDE